MKTICLALSVMFLAATAAEAADQKKSKRTKSQRVVVVQEQAPAPSPMGFIGRVIILPFDIAQTVVGHAVAIPVGVLGATRRVVDPGYDQNRR